jgi:hypothetical protein
MEQTFRDPVSFNRADVHQKNLEMVVPTAKCVWHPEEDHGKGNHSGLPKLQNTFRNAYTCKCLSTWCSHLTERKADHLIVKEVNTCTNTVNHFWTGITVHCQNLLGQQLIVHADHENLTYKETSTQIASSDGDCSSKITVFFSITSKAHKKIGCRCSITSRDSEQSYEQRTPHWSTSFDDEDFPATAFPAVSYACLGKAQSTDVAILKETAKTKSFDSIQPFTAGQEKQENSFATMAKLWSLTNTSKSHPMVSWLPWTSWYQQNWRNHWSTPLVV